MACFKKKYFLLLFVFILILFLKPRVSYCTSGSFNITTNNNNSYIIDMNGHSDNYNAFIFLELYNSSSGNYSYSLITYNSSVSRYACNTSSPFTEVRTSTEAPFDTYFNPSDYTSHFYSYPLSKNGNTFYAGNSNELYSGYQRSTNGSCTDYFTNTDIHYCDIGGYPSRPRISSEDYSMLAPSVQPPTLNNTTSELENLNFSNFVIYGNDYSSDDIYMLFYNISLSNSQNTEGLYPISEKLLTSQSIYYDAESSSEGQSVYKLPIYKTGCFFNVGSTYCIRFALKTWSTEYNTFLYDYIGTSYYFTISSNVTQDYINQLNTQTATSTESDGFSELNTSINEQTNAINNQSQAINGQTNTILDSSLSNDYQLPTDNTNNPTSSGIDNIFTIIYNSFTSGTPQNVVFPIPFTDKSITLEPSYIYNMLHNNGADWIIYFIQAFYWYIISRFIIKDIANKVRKIKGGNLENIQNSNIKEEML